MNEFTRFTKYLKDIKTQVMYGGAPITEHINSLKGLHPPHIIVGTPGRILGLVKRKDLDLSNLKMFVLDECDKMLEASGMTLQTNKTNLPYRHEI